MVLRYRLLKELLDWHPGYIIELSATGKFGWLGSGDYGWELPMGPHGLTPVVPVYLACSAS